MSQNQNQQKEEKINVILRIKPKLPDDIEKKYSLIKVTNHNSISIINDKKEQKNFCYDYIAEENSTQKDIFEHYGQIICDYSLKGYNGTIFAYGQTGSGKTYTLLGKSITNTIENRNNITNFDMEINGINNDYKKNDERIGLIPRILYYLFDKISNIDNENNFTFKLSYMEIYNDTIKDLLNPNNKEKIEISDTFGKIDFKNLCKLTINSIDEALKYIIDGNKLRHTASNTINKESSRSHAIISIYIENYLLKENMIKKSVFHIIDLAGSEKQNQTNTYGVQVKEAGSINKSLFNLSLVIRNIINNKKPIPYRDSLLTHLLRDSIGGNAKTLVIATISQLACNLNETFNTLDFAQNAKKIKNKIIVNEISNVNDIEILKKELEIFQKKYNTKCEELQKEYNNNINSIINEKEIISKNLELQKENINEMREEIIKKEEELKKYIKENKELKNEIENLDNALKFKNDEIITLKSKFNKENMELSEENNGFKNKINSLEEEIKSFNEKIKNMIDNHKREISDMENKNQNIQNKNISVLSEINEKINLFGEKLEKFEINSKKKNLDELNKIKFEDLEMKLKNKDEEIKSLGDNILNDKKTKEKMNKIINELEEKINKLEIKYEESKKSISEHLEEINNLNQQNIKLQDEKKALSEHFSDLLKESCFFSICYNDNELLEDSYLNFEYHGLLDMVNEIIDNTDNKFINIKRSPPYYASTLIELENQLWKRLNSFFEYANQNINKANRGIKYLLNNIINYILKNDI